VETDIAARGSITFTGKSGQKYQFQIWPLETRFNHVPAVFMITKRVFSDRTYRRMASHEVVFIGQTENLEAPLAPPLHLDRFARKGANCVCVYVSANEDERMTATQDLVAGNNPSCND
jgi:hypothetical protein